MKNNSNIYKNIKKIQFLNKLKVKIFKNKKWGGVGKHQIDVGEKKGGFKAEQAYEPPPSCASVPCDAQTSQEEPG